MPAEQEWQNFPGATRIKNGLKQLDESDYNNTDALLLQITAPRLRELGFTIRAPVKEPQTNESKLYTLLQATHGDAAHASYNALLQEIDSFATAADHFLITSNKKSI